jgi:hypothetical protein
MTQMQQQQSDDGMLAKARQGFDIIYFLALGHTLCLTAIIRSRFGVEALGWPVVAAIVVQMLYALVSPSEAMVMFFPVWVLFIINRRFCAWHRYRKGHQGHSRYMGFPWLAKKFCTWESTAKGFVEPVLCLLVGALLMPVSESLGFFVMGGFISMLVVQAIEGEINMRRTRRMRDAWIEQKELSARFKGR